MDCRKCGACCVALSISSAIPGMRGGKPAGVPCAHLTEERGPRDSLSGFKGSDPIWLCSLFGKPSRPKVCTDFPPGPDTCGGDREEALLLMAEMERATRPDPRR